MPLSVSSMHGVHTVFTETGEGRPIQRQLITPATPGCCFCFGVHVGALGVRSSSAALASARPPAPDTSRCTRRACAQKQARGGQIGQFRQSESQPICQHITGRRSVVTDLSRAPVCPSRFVCLARCLCDRPHYQSASPGPRTWHSARIDPIGSKRACSPRQARISAWRPEVQTSPQK